MLNNLNGIAAISPTDIWAVGQTNPLSGGMPSTLTEHWNGTSWTIVPSPNAGTQGSALNAVAAVSTNDVWAVGYLGIGYSGPLIEHWNGTNWNGTTWSIVASPNSSLTQNLLHAITPVPGSNQLWAVGTATPMSGPSIALIERWNGSTWSLVNRPNLGQDGGFLSGVSAVSATDVWTVGGVNPFASLTEQYTPSRTLINCPKG